MTQIAFVNNATHSHADRLFNGVFGTINSEGEFEVSPSLRKIYIFSILTKEVMREMRIGENLTVLEVNDEVAPAVTALLLQALGRRWDAMYKAVDAGGNAMVRAAKEAERLMVAEGIAKGVADLQLPSGEVQLQKLFSNVPATWSDGEDVDEVSSNLLKAATAAAAPGQWSMHQEHVETEGMSSSTSTSNTSLDYVSGRLITEVTLHGYLQHLPELLHVIPQLPGSIREHLPTAENAKFAAVEWHTYRPQQVEALALEDAADEGSIDLTEAAATAAPAP